MIRVNRVPEPGDFDAKVRQPGNAKLRPTSQRRPPALWSAYKPALADGFRQLCGYSAMYEPVGTVDHYLSWQNHRTLAYEWGNYRFASAWMNSSKGTEDDRVLDPFEVEDGWFEILLPSLQLVVGDSVPAAERARAEHTLKRLHLDHDERVIRQRAEWYRMYREGELTLEGLRTKAPLIARAIEAAATGSP